VADYRTLKLILSKRKSELIEPQKNLFKEKMIVGMLADCSLLRV